MVNLERDGSTVAAEAVGSHFDLLFQILLRLPANSLINFKTVSREWYNLISSTQFCLEHTRRNLNPKPIGTFLSNNLSAGDVRHVKLHEDYCVKSYSRPVREFPKSLFVIDCCNGLLLCSCNGLDRWDAKSKLYVCNPTTKHVATIPHLFEREQFFSKLILCFDPSTPEKYSIVCLWKILNQCFSIDVYECETGSWRHSVTFSKDDYPINPLWGGVFWNGAVHWVDYNGYALYCFDLNRECFRRSMLLPKTSKSWQFDIQTFQGHLYVLQFVQASSPFMLMVYEIEHDFSSLSAKYSIRHDSLNDHYVSGIFIGEEGQAFIVLCIGSDVYTYNACVSNSFHSHTLSDDFIETDCSCYIYTESLAPI